jgi:hypothetical protein
MNVLVHPSWPCDYVQSFRAIMYITHDICNLYDFELKELKAWLFDRYADNVRCDTSVHK